MVAKLYTLNALGAILLQHHLRWESFVAPYLQQVRGFSSSIPAIGISIVALKTNQEEVKALVVFSG